MQANSFPNYHACDAGQTLSTLPQRLWAARGTSVRGRVRKSVFHAAFCPCSRAAQPPSSVLRAATADSTARRLLGRCAAAHKAQLAWARLLEKVPSSLRVHDLLPQAELPAGRARFREREKGPLQREREKGPLQREREGPASEREGRARFREREKGPLQREREKGSLQRKRMVGPPRV